MDNSTPQPVQPTPSVPSVSKSGSKKLPVIIGGILILALGLLGGYMFANQSNTKSNQSPQPTLAPGSSPSPVNGTANWKTYNNTLYNYSISYPNTWTTQLIASGGLNKEALPESTGLNILEKNSTREYPEGVITIQGFGLAPSYGSDFQKSTVTINGISMTKYEKTLESNLVSNVYLFQTLDKKNHIEVLIIYNSADSIKESLNEILSTFEFTNSTSNSETTNLKKYTNSEDKFSFQYPSTWDIQDCGPTSNKTIIQIGPEFLTDTKTNCQTNQTSVIAFVIYDQKSNIEGYSTTSTKKVTVAGIQATYLVLKNTDAPGPDTMTRVEIPLPNGKYVYINLTNEEEKDTLDEILSTFKFTQ